MTSTLKSSSSNKAGFVSQLFNDIAYKYDLLNNLMSFGTHKRWKEETIKLALNKIKNPQEALDLCSGTGDLAIILNKLTPETNITCIDSSQNMLKIAESKINNLNLNKIKTLLSDIENLSYKPKSIDLITIGFGLRNTSNKEKCLEIIFHLLKDRGVFACIDLGHPQNKLWKTIYSSYFFKVIPKLGQMFAHNESAYLYLTDSLNTWYKQEELKDLILKTGFRECYLKNILGGVVAIHVAVK